MKNDMSRLWQAAIPFLQKCRPGDLIHTSIAMQHMEEIMAGEGIEDEILMPTIILHDIGWSACPAELVRNFFTNVKDADTNRQLRITHMEAGAQLSRDVLKTFGYDALTLDRVASIIIKHDIADAMTTCIEKIVFDADFSWRFSQAGFYLDLERFAGDSTFNMEKAIRRLEESVSTLKTETGRDIAQRELKARKSELR